MKSHWIPLYLVTARNPWSSRPATGKLKKKRKWVYIILHISYHILYYIILYYIILYYITLYYIILVPSIHNTCKDQMFYYNWLIPVSAVKRPSSGQLRIMFLCAVKFVVQWDPIVYIKTWHIMKFLVMIKIFNSIIKIIK